MAADKLRAAIAAAEEFKLLLDVQPVGKLFNPGGKGDARSSGGYAEACMLLSHALAQGNQGGMRPGQMSFDIVPVGQLIAGNGVDARSQALDVLQRVRGFLLSLGLQEGNQHAGGAEDSGAFELRFGNFRQIDQIAELAESKGNAVHGAAPEIVGGIALCHGAPTPPEITQ